MRQRDWLVVQRILSVNGRAIEGIPTMEPASRMGRIPAMVIINHRIGSSNQHLITSKVTVKNSAFEEKFGLYDFQIYIKADTDEKFAVRLHRRSHWSGPGPTQQSLFLGDRRWLGWWSHCQGDSEDQKSLQEVDKIPEITSNEGYNRAKVRRYRPRPFSHLEVVQPNVWKRLATCPSKAHVDGHVIRWTSFWPTSTTGRGDSGILIQCSKQEGCQGTCLVRHSAGKMWLHGKRMACHQCPFRSIWGELQTSKDNRPNPY